MPILSAPEFLCAAFGCACLAALGYAGWASARIVGALIELIERDRQP